MITRTATQPSARSAGAGLAPYWHTALLVAVMLSVAVTGTLLDRGQGAPALVSAPAAASFSARLFQIYLPILAVNWGLVLYVSRLFRTHNALPDLLGRRWRNARSAGIDLLLALLVCALIQALEVLATHHFGAGRNAAISALLPRTGAERLTWLLVASSVGFCEEVVYRGYLQTQIAAFTGHASIGVALQAALFGIAHANQGFAAATRIASYGLILGILAHFRRSLLPGIASHVLIDIASGF